MRVEVVVDAREGEGPYQPGVAEVYVDGKLHARLRTGERYTIKTTEAFTAQFHDDNA